MEFISVNSFTGDSYPNTAIALLPTFDQAAAWANSSTVGYGLTDDRYNVVELDRINIVVAGRFQTLRSADANANFTLVAGDPNNPLEDILGIFKKGFSPDHAKTWRDTYAPDATLVDVRLIDARHRVRTVASL